MKNGKKTFVSKKKVFLGSATEQQPPVKNGNYF